MKKYTFICAAVCAAMFFTSCKSSESAYKQAYLKAKQQEELQQRQQAEQQTLKQQGYNAQVVVNNNVEPAMYRVVATTFATKAEAASSRASLQQKYPGAWLLYAK